jgi:PfaD family protein
LSLSPIGSWWPAEQGPAFAGQALTDVVASVRETTFVVQDAQGRVGAVQGGQARMGTQGGWPLLAVLPPMYPEWLGDRSFCETHGTRFPYVTGAMANGIATVDIVREMARAGCMGFFGSAGLPFERVKAAVAELGRDLGDRLPWGSNLIHSPNEPDLEQAIADLYVHAGVPKVSAAAYMALTPMIVQVAFAGVTQRPDGSIHRPRHVFAKVSRPEVAERFLAPPPAEMLQALVASGRLTADEARLARHLPVAEDITAESDSGGHTDNRPLTALFPSLLEARDRMAARHSYDRPIRVGAAGGLGTPSAVAAAFSLGAAYVLTGSVNQGAVESGLSPVGRSLLANAGLADVVMAPAADMFELGVEVQVLRRGTMFGVRAKKLHELYVAYDSMDAIPADERSKLERTILRKPLTQVWADCVSFFSERDPRELERAARDPKHQLALCFRWYLGQSSRWAIRGVPDRAMDFQIWCGPAMGAFNDWVQGSFLQPPEARGVVQIARNLMEGAAVVSRAQQLRSAGVPVPPQAFQFRPRPLG